MMGSANTVPRNAMIVGVLIAEDRCGSNDPRDGLRWMFTRRAIHKLVCMKDGSGQVLLHHGPPVSLLGVPVDDQEIGLVDANLLLQMQTEIT